MSSNLYNIENTVSKITGVIQTRGIKYTALGKELDMDRRSVSEMAKCEGRVRKFLEMLDILGLEMVVVDKGKFVFSGELSGDLVSKINSLNNL